MQGEIKKFCRDFFLDYKIKGSLIFAGSFSRNEVSFVDGKLISDMETLFIYEHKKSCIGLDNLVKNLSTQLIEEFNCIQSTFEIEIEKILISDLKLKKSFLPVHIFEALNEPDYIFNFNEIDISDFKVSILSVYDIYVHRILNHISLIYNFQSINLNKVFTNRCTKNISDFLTYNYLLDYNPKDKFIKSKAERINLLTNKESRDSFTKFLNNEMSDYFLYFHLWKKLMINWNNDYTKRNKKFESCIVNKSQISKVYETIILILLKIFLKKKPNINQLIDSFQKSLINSDSFEEFNSKLRFELAKFGYNRFSYIFLNATFFMYWLKDYNYYKNIK